MDSFPTENDIKILAIDTTSQVGSVALTAGDSLLGEYLLLVAQAHSEKLLSNPIIEDFEYSLEEVK